MLRDPAHHTLLEFSSMEMSKKKFDLPAQAAFSWDFQIAYLGC